MWQQTSDVLGKRKHTAPTPTVAGLGATTVGAGRIAEQAAVGNAAATARVAADASATQVHAPQVSASSIHSRPTPRSPGGGAVSSVASIQVSPSRVEAVSAAGGSSAAGGGNAEATAASANPAAAGGHATMATAAGQEHTNGNKVGAVLPGLVRLRVITVIMRNISIRE